MKKLLVVVAACLVLSACQTLQNITPEQKEMACAQAQKAIEKFCPAEAAK